MSDILDLIDNALADVAIGEDAMRWTPDAPAVSAAGGGVSVRARDERNPHVTAGVIAVLTGAFVALTSIALHLKHVWPGAVIATVIYLAFQSVLIGRRP